jgi:hypothetical protein
MNIQINPRPTLSLAFGGKSKLPASPAPASTLSKSELKQIVVGILG